MDKAFAAFDARCFESLRMQLNIDINELHLLTPRLTPQRPHRWHFNLLLFRLHMSTMTRAATPINNASLELRAHIVVTCLM